LSLLSNTLRSTGGRRIPETCHDRGAHRGLQVVGTAPARRLPTRSTDPSYATSGCAPWIFSVAIHGPAGEATAKFPRCPVNAGAAAGTLCGVTFEEYVAARGQALVRFAALLSGDEHRAEDLVQDALTKAYLRWAHIRRGDDPDVYLRRLVLNASRSWWRRRRNRELAVVVDADAPGPGELDAEAAERDALWRLIRALPERQRAVVVLRYYEDLDDDTIARILDCSPVTVRTHAMRALHRLRDDYKEAATP
jgi:RNA polymerase sigma-70 factor (sigma-E family)